MAINCAATRTPACGSAARTLPARRPETRSESNRRWIRRWRKARGHRRQTPDVHSSWIQRREFLFESSGTKVGPAYRTFEEAVASGQPRILISRKYFCTIRKEKKSLIGGKSRNRWLSAIFTVWGGLEIRNRRRSRECPYSLGEPWKFVALGRPVWGRVVVTWRCSQKHIEVARELSTATSYPIPLCTTTPNRITDCHCRKLNPASK